MRGKRSVRPEGLIDASRIHAWTRFKAKEPLMCHVAIDSNVQDIISGENRKFLIDLPGHKWVMVYISRGFEGVFPANAKVRRVKTEEEKAMRKDLGTGTLMLFPASVSDGDIFGMGRLDPVDNLPLKINLRMSFFGKYDPTERESLFEMRGGLVSGMPIAYAALFAPGDRIVSSSMENGNRWLVHHDGHSLIQKIVSEDELLSMFPQAASCGAKG